MLLLVGTFRRHGVSSTKAAEFSLFSLKEANYEKAAAARYDLIIRIEVLRHFFFPPNLFACFSLS